MSDKEVKQTPTEPLKHTCTACGHVDTITDSKDVMVSVQLNGGFDSLDLDELMTARLSSNEFYPVLKQLKLNHVKLPNDELVYLDQVGKMQVEGSGDELLFDFWKSGGDGVTMRYNKKTGVLFFGTAFHYVVSAVFVGTYENGYLNRTLMGELKPYVRRTAKIE